MRILVLSKRQYTNKDLIDDRYGRLYELPEKLAELGHKVAGLCLSYRQRKEGHLAGPTINNSPVDWYSVNLGKMALPGLTIYWKKLNYLLSQFKPDIIYACSDAPHAILGVYVASKLEIPCVIDLYDNFESFKLTATPGMLYLFRRAVSEAAGVVCISYSLQQYIEKEYNPRGLICTISNGVCSKVFHPIDKLECRKKLGLPRNGTFIGTAGSLGASRGIDALFDGYQELAITDPSIHLVLAGPVEPGTLLPKGKLIHYLGNLGCQDVPLMLNSLDIGVVCNIQSLFGKYCFPQKMFEMLACGIRVVGARTGDVITVFEHEPDCLFIPGDGGSLALAVRRAIEKPKISLAQPVKTWGELAVSLDSLLHQVVNTKKREVRDNGATVEP